MNIQGHLTGWDSHSEQSEESLRDMIKHPLKSDRHFPPRGSLGEINLPGNIPTVWAFARLAVRDSNASLGSVFSTPLFPYSFMK